MMLSTVLVNFVYEPLQVPRSLIDLKQVPVLHGKFGHDDRPYLHEKNPLNIILYVNRKCPLSCNYQLTY